MFLCCISDFIIDYWRVWLGIFIVQGLLGVACFEWAWAKVDRARLGEEACMAEFPSFRRLDTHMWKRSAFYPGCFLFLMARACIIMLPVLWIGFVQRILYAGENLDEPLTGWKRQAHKWTIWFWAPIVLLGFGYRIDYT